MTKFLVLGFATLFSFTAFSFNAMAAEVYLVDLATPIEEQLAENCPWVPVAELQKVVIAESEKIGWAGGDVGDVIGDLLGNSGVDANHTEVAANIPESTKAVLLDTQYFNNNGEAKILVERLRMITASGDQNTFSLSEESRVLSQTEGHAGEAILICFTNDENYVRVSAKVTHQNVDGSRPTIGISAFTVAAPIVLE